MKKIIIHKLNVLRVKGLRTQYAPIDCNYILIYTDEILNGTKYLDCFGPIKLSCEENIELANKYNIDKFSDPAYYYNLYNDGIIDKQVIGEILTERLGLKYNEDEIIVSPGCREMVDKIEVETQDGFLKRLFRFLFKS